MNSKKKLCYLAVLTALYVVLSSFLKFTLIGNIQIDLGYIAFAVALCMFGVQGAIVGVIGCALESILFSAYGFSLSWAVANAIIGIGCGLLYSRSEKFLWRFIITVIFAALGMIVAKTAIECYLYSIPLAVKIPKNAIAFAADATTMIFGLTLYDTIIKKNKRGEL